MGGPIFLKAYFPTGDRIKEHVDQLVLDLNQDIKQMNNLFQFHNCPNILPYDSCFTDKDFKAVVCV